MRFYQPHFSELPRSDATKNEETLPQQQQQQHSYRTTRIQTVIYNYIQRTVVVVVVVMVGSTVPYKHANVPPGTGN